MIIGTLGFKSKVVVRDLHGRLVKAMQGVKSRLLNDTVTLGLEEIDKVIVAISATGKKGKYSKGTRRYKAHVDGKLNKALKNRSDWKYTMDGDKHSEEFFDHHAFNFDRRYGKRTKNKGDKKAWSYSARDYWDRVTKPGNERGRKTLQNTLTYRRNFSAKMVGSSMEIYHKVLAGEVAPPTVYVEQKDGTNKLNKSDPKYPLYLEEGTKKAKAFHVVRTAIANVRKSSATMLMRNDAKYKAVLKEIWEKVEVSE